MIKSIALFAALSTLLLSSNTTATPQTMPSLSPISSSTIYTNSAPTININKTNSSKTSAYTGNIAKLVSDPSSVSQADLDKAIIDYIGKTNDIGMLFNVIDYLSQNATDQIMTSYIKKTNDIGMIFSAMDHLSQSAIDEIAANYAKLHNDPGMTETLSPYVSAGVLNNTGSKGKKLTANTKNKNTTNNRTNMNESNSWMNGIVQMNDFFNVSNKSVSCSDSFTVTDEEELVVFSTMKSGTFSFDLFSPDNKQVLHINSKETDQTVSLTPGTWAYNYTLNGSKGLALVVARKKNVPIDIVMQNFELHK